MSTPDFIANIVNNGYPSLRKWEHITGIIVRFVYGRNMWTGVDPVIGILPVRCPWNR